MPSNNKNAEGTSTGDDLLEQLQKFRGAHRGATMKLINMANDLIQQNIGTLDDGGLARMKMINTQLKEKQRGIKQMDSQILGKCHITDIDKEINKATDVSTQIIKAISELEDFPLGKYSTLPEERTPEIPNTSTPTRNISSLTRLERSSTSENSNLR